MHYSTIRTYIIFALILNSLIVTTVRGATLHTTINLCNLNEDAVLEIIKKKLNLNTTIEFVEKKPFCILGGYDPYDEDEFVILENGSLRINNIDSIGPKDYCLVFANDTGLLNAFKCINPTVSYVISIAVAAISFVFLIYKNYVHRREVGILNELNLICTTFIIHRILMHVDFDFKEYIGIFFNFYFIYWSAIFISKQFFGKSTINLFWNCVVQLIVMGYSIGISILLQSESTLEEIPDENTTTKVKIWTIVFYIITTIVLVAIISTLCVWWKRERGNSNTHDSIIWFCGVVAIIFLDDVACVVSNDCIPNIYVFWGFNCKPFFQIMFVTAICWMNLQENIANQRQLSESSLPNIPAFENLSIETTM